MRRSNLPKWWQKALAPEKLRTLAGVTTFLRGERYAALGRVLQLEFIADHLIAQVNGTQVYQIRLWRRGNQLQFACSCPPGCEGAFCKHCVAAGLASADVCRTRKVNPLESAQITDFLFE